MKSQHILLIGGLLLFLSGTGCELYYQLLLKHPYQQSLFYNLDMGLNMAAKGDLQAASAFASAYQATAAAVDILTRIPLYLMLTGTFTATLLFADPYLDTSETMKRIFALLVVSGGFLAATGSLLSLYIPAIGEQLLLLGGLSWVALAIAGYMIYILLYLWLHQPSSSSRGKRQRSNVNEG